MMTELRLQQICFMWHWNSFPSERRQLFMVYNNPRNAIEGTQLKGAGMVKGVADMQYLRPFKTPVFIEFKLPGEEQSEAQIKFQAVVESIGYEYKVCTSLDEFKTIIAEAQE